MGATGSYTAKATIDPLLYPFTKWATKEVTLFIQRGQIELPETFALRKHEFDYLIGEESLSFTALRDLFKEIFDTDNNGLVDKFEVMCIILMASKVSSLDKVNFFFAMFNFNDKGYLNESELTLLIMAVTRGAFKIDQKFVPPPAKAVKALVEEAFTYARRQSDQLRKPELVDFVQHNVDVAAFLECWRGHASQVLLPEGARWRDLSFPCHHVSIAPSKEWLSLGLPPEEFIHWRRREKVGTEADSLAYLFVHTESFLKTVDRKPVYKGEGVLGTGYVKQGYLADRWVLNALAVLSAKPPTVFYTFATTGQEDQGRFCCKLFECGSWRSVYVDDRIPCGPNLYPLFATSSSPLEAWPAILEKALAKYLGSYGHIGAASSRPDSILTALRYFTGGHVYRQPTQDFVWATNVNEMEVPAERNGAAKVLQYLSEGSVIALVRTAALALMTPVTAVKANAPSTTTTTVPSRHLLPPIGHLFPVVGSRKEKGFLHLILRDPWGLLQDAEHGVDKTTGFCNTFSLRVEDISLFYDTLVAVRYPDSLREQALVHKRKAWNTEILSQVSQHRYRPAAFDLVVHKKVSSSHAMSDRKMRRRSTAAEIDLALHAADLVTGKATADSIDGVKKLTMEELQPHLRLKERTDFSRVNDKKNAFLHHDQTNAEVPDGSAAGGKASKAMKKGGAGDGLLEDERVEVCLTISSNCEWSTAGAETLGAELRARLVPSVDTLKRMRNQIMKNLYQKKVLEIQLHNMRVEENKLLEVQNEIDDGTPQISTASSRRNSMLGPGTGSRRGSTLHASRTSFADVGKPQQQPPLSQAQDLQVGAKVGEAQGPQGADETKAADQDHSDVAKDSGDTKDPTQTKGDEEGKSSKPKGPTRASLVNELRSLTDISWESIEAESLVLLKQQLQTQLTYSAKRCWESRPLYLLPGRYTLFADVTYAGNAPTASRFGTEEDPDDILEQLANTIPYEQVKMMCVPRDLHEAPWLDEALVKKYMRRRHVFHGVGGEGWFGSSHEKSGDRAKDHSSHRLTRGGSHNQSYSQSHSQSRGLLKTGSEGPRPTLRRKPTNASFGASAASIDNHSTGSHNSLTSLQYLEQKIFPPQKAMDDVGGDDDLPPLQHHIWLEVSSFDKITVSPLPPGTEELDATLLYEEEDEERLRKLSKGRSGRAPQSQPQPQPQPQPQTLSTLPKGPLGQIVEADSALLTSSTTLPSGGLEAASSILPSTSQELLLQGGSIDGSSVASSFVEDATLPRPIVVAPHTLDMDVVAPCWPLMVETQAEAASAFLVDQLSLQRESAEALAAEFVEIASKVNRLKKAAITQRRTTLRSEL